ncbi:MAG: hypothetical protein R3Y05_05935 [bacterium]
MIRQILNEKNKSIRDSILAYAHSTYSNNKLYFALSRTNHDLAAIGYSYENFIKCEQLESDYMFFETTFFEMKLYTELVNKQLSNKHLYKLSILIMLHINDINLDEHLESIGITIEEFYNLLDYRVKKVKGTYKFYDRTQLIQTLRFKNKYTLDEYIDSKLVKEIKLEDIPYV